MKLLHTSDWHLGRSLHGEPMLAHQRDFLGWLVELAVDRAVDAVLVAGDVYDRAVPPTDAVAVLDEALLRFAEAGVPMVLSSGNHDSAIRLGFGAGLAEHAGVHLRTRPAELSRPVLIGDTGVYGIPYLLPDAVRDELGAERSHESVLRAAVGRIRADAAARGIERVVVLAHAFVTGGASCDSERDIRVGGIGDAPASVFDGVSYAALGHLHGAQQVTPRVRYSGSPLPFSFSEHGHVKSVSVVEIDPAGRPAVEPVPVPVPRPMHELRGRLADLLAATSGPPADSWLKVVLTDPSRPVLPMERLRERWPHTLVLDWQPERAPSAAADDLARLRRQSDPIEICAQFVEWVDSTYPDHGQRGALAAAVEAALLAERTA